MDAIKKKMVALRYFISLLSVVCYLLFFVGYIFKCYLLSDKGLYVILSFICYLLYVS
jgi:hypothetical protein